MSQAGRQGGRQWSIRGLERPCKETSDKGLKSTRKVRTFRVVRPLKKEASSPPPSVFAARQLEPPRCRPFQYLGPDPYITIHTKVSNTFSPHLKPAIQFSLPDPLHFLPPVHQFSLFNSRSHFNLIIFQFFNYTNRFLPHSDHRRPHTADDTRNHDHYRLAAPIPTPAARR